MGKHIIHEAKRCLQCKNPKCVAACPVDTAIPEMIQLLLSGQIHTAGQQLFENNPLTLVCSMVCPHEKQCEGNCILGIKSSPVQISSIEHYISDYSHENLQLKPTQYREGSLAIIGSGPAGITIAFIMAMKGYKVTLFESNEKIGGVLRYGIPEFRLPKSILDRLQGNLIKLGVRIRPNTLIGQNLTLEELFRDGFNAVFIGTGVWKPNKLNIKGETLGNVHFAIDYLRNPEVYKLGERVTVIGAGNVAMDVSRTALRNGAKHVRILNRLGEDTITARQYEVEYAKIDGVAFEHFRVPLELKETGVYAIKTELVDGKMSLIEGSEEIIESDSIIIAVSQGPKANIVSTTKGIEVDHKGLLKTDETGSTTLEGVFASGDVVTGARTVVEAVKYSKLVADEIALYIDICFNQDSNI